MFSLFKAIPNKPKTRLVKLSRTENLLPQYAIQEHSRITGWDNAEPAFYATDDTLALEVYQHWKKKDEVVILTN